MGDHSRTELLTNSLSSLTKSQKHWDQKHFEALTFKNKKPKGYRYIYISNLFITLRIL